MDGQASKRVTVRTMAAALLENEGELLMMHRSPTRTLAPNMWSAVGGHLEGDEFHDPGSGCLREIREETGLDATDLLGFRLRFILYRLRDGELRHQYVFHALTTTRNVGTTDEGTLHWIRKSEMKELTMPPSAVALVDRFLGDDGIADPPVYAGILSRSGVAVEGAERVSYGGFDVHWVQLPQEFAKPHPRVRYAGGFGIGDVPSHSMDPTEGNAADPTAWADRYGHQVVGPPWFGLGSDPSSTNAILCSVLFPSDGSEHPSVQVSGSGGTVIVPLVDWEG